MVAAAALELFHAFALIHDDILDGSERRRGSPRSTGSSPICTPDPPGGATRRRTGATPRCSAATCVRPGPTRCFTSAA
ncbi:polyprenyl synthetase family protein [Micromonospora sp. LOL_024]|uniref:polyprenyl synthetase family protein n=1 Tax=Micromonospora sp. LOL_024 TaxID=3345412 RepID=UPI003A889AB2